MASESDEFEIYERAYQKLFQAVLAKKQGTPEQKSQIFDQLKTYLQNEVKTPETFIDHIPEFSKILKVPQPSLASFIGQNALRAINLSREEIQKEKKEKGPDLASVVFKDRDTSMIEQILKFARPNLGESRKFEEIEGGYLKLVWPGGEQPGTSLTGETPDSDDASDAPSESAESTSKSESSGISSVASAPTPAIQLQEESVIQEILEKFGSVLNVTEKLEPEPFPADMNQSDVSFDDPDSSQLENQDYGTTVTGNTAQVSSPASPQSFDEQSVIEEILNRFGNILNVTTKLEPSDGLDESDNPFADDSDTAGDSEEEDYDDEPDFEPVPMPFSRYAQIRQKMAGFAKTKDTEGYNQYLSSLDEPGKAVVGVRNVLTRVESGKLNDPEEHYRQIAARLSFELTAIVHLSRQMKAFDKMQEAMNQFIAKAKSAAPPVLKAIQSVWSQYRMLLDNLGHGSVESELKLVLLSITDPGVKSAVEKHLLALTEKLKLIYDSAG